MLHLYRLTLATAALGSGLALLNAGSSVAQSLCLMQTASGRTINLTHLCGQRSPNSTAGTPSTRPANANTRSTTIPVRPPALVEPVVSQGQGGSHYYEVRRIDGGRYRLLVWRVEHYPQGSPSRVPDTFDSSAEALAHFDCHYTDKAIASCPSRPSTSPSYETTPRTRSRGSISF
jgi:hypothetical protein